MEFDTGMPHGGDMNKDVESKEINKTGGTKRTRKQKKKVPVVAASSSTPDAQTLEPGVSGTLRRSKRTKQLKSAAVPEPQKSQPETLPKSRSRRARKNAKKSAAGATSEKQIPKDEAIDVSQPAKKAKTSHGDSDIASTSELQLSEPGPSRVLRSSKKDKNTSMHSDTTSTSKLQLSEPGPSGVSRSSKKSKESFLFQVDSAIQSRIYSPEHETSDESLFSPSTDDDSICSVSSSDEVNTDSKRNITGKFLEGQSHQSRLSKFTKRRKLNPSNAVFTDGPSSTAENARSLTIKDYLNVEPTNNNISLLDSTSQPSTSKGHPTLGRLLQARARLEMTSPAYRHTEFLRDYISNNRRQELTRDYLKDHPDVNEEQIMYTYFGDLIHLSNKRKPMSTVKAKESTVSQELQLMNLKLQKKIYQEENKMFASLGLKPARVIERVEDVYKFMNENGNKMRINLKRTSECNRKKDKNYSYVESMNMINEAMTMNSMPTIWWDKYGTAPKRVMLSKKSKDKKKSSSKNEGKVFAGQYGYITKEYAEMISRTLPNLAKVLKIHVNQEYLNRERVGEVSSKEEVAMNAPIEEANREVAEKNNANQNIEMMTDLQEETNVPGNPDDFDPITFIKFKNPDNANEVLNNRFKRYVLRISDKLKEMNKVIGELLNYHSKKKKLAGSNNQIGIWSKLNMKSYENTSNALGDMYLTISNNIYVLREAIEQLEFFVNMEKYRKFYEKPKLNIPAQFDTSLLLAISQEIFHPPLALYIIAALNALTIQKEVMNLIEGVYIIYD